MKENDEKTPKEIKINPKPLKRLLYEDEGVIECDMCGTTVSTKHGEFIYNAEIDMVYFYCNRCLEEEKGH